MLSSEWPDVVVQKTLHWIFSCAMLPGASGTILHRVFPGAMLSRCVWDNIALENYLSKFVNPEHTDIVLQQNNLHNVVLNLPGPTLYKAITCAMLSKVHKQLCTGNNLQFCLDLSGPTFYNILQITCAMLAHAWQTMFMRKITYTMLYQPFWGNIA